MFINIIMMIIFDIDILIIWSKKGQKQKEIIILCLKNYKENKQLFSFWKLKL